MIRVLSDFFYGLFLPLRALGLIIRRKKLLALSVLPLIITIGLSILGLSAFKSAAMGYGMKLLADWGWATEGLGVRAAIFLFDILLIVVGALTFSIVAGVVASPFNDFLAEAAEPDAGPGLPALTDAQKSVGFRVRSIGIDIVKTLFVGVLQAGLLLGGVIVIWIPGLNVLLLTCTFLLLTYQYVSYPQTRRGVGLAESVLFLRRNLVLSIGFGSSLAFLFAIPLVAAVTLPLAVVGGTLLFGRAETRAK